MRVRRASVDEAATLTRLARASKASWGYPEAWLREWGDELTITAEWIRDNTAFVAERQGQLVGMVGVGEGGSGPELAHLWIAPDCQGHGLGRILVDRARGVAIARRWPSLRILSDPYARPFYEHLGAVHVGEVPAPAEGAPNRTLPLLRLDV